MPSGADRTSFMGRYLFILCFITLMSAINTWATISETGESIRVIISSTDRESSVVETVREHILSSNVPVTDFVILSEDGEGYVDAVNNGRHDVVIVLGQTLYTLHKGASDLQKPVLFGAYHHKNGIGPGVGISLDMDPVMVIKEAGKTGLITQALGLNIDEFIERVLGKSGQLDITVRSWSGQSEVDVARGWFNTMAAAEGDADMVWIADSTRIVATGSLRYIVERAWEKGIFVVSSVPAYANRGVSMGFVPDFEKYTALLISNALLLAQDPAHVPYPLIDSDAVIRIFNQRSLRQVGRSLPDDLDRSPYERDIVVR